MIIVTTMSMNASGLRIGQSHGRARYTDREIDLVLWLRDRGWSYEAIARKMEMPKSTVREYCKGRCRCQVAA